MKNWLMPVTIIALVGGFTLIIWLGAGKNSEIRAKYDERQLIAQGRGYKWGFLSMLALGAAYIMAEAISDRQLLTAGELMMTAACLGVAVMAVYDIVKDAWIPLGRGKIPVYLWAAMMCAGAFVRAIEYIKSRKLLSESRLGGAVPYFSVAAMCLAILVSMVVKDLLRRREDE